MQIVHVLILIVPYLWGLCSSYKQNCQCVYLSGTQGQLWGKFVISSVEVRYNKSECVHIFITGTEQEIIELRFEQILLRKGCSDQLHVFPHLREAVLQDPIEPEETICSENSKNFLAIISGAGNTSTHQIPHPTARNSSITSNNIESSIGDNIHNFNPVTRKDFRIKYRPSIFSSDKVLGMRLIYRPIQKDDAFKIIGRFQFIDRVMFKNDGNLVATTYCDYQFLPHPINYDGKLKNDVDLWRYFHSPRYPAKYPDHIKCTYKFIGRPRNRVEVLFEEIYLLTGHSSCLHHSDKISVYDSKIADMSSIVDVFCNENPAMRVISSGPNLLIEFEASSNRTSNGFSAKYRFVDIFPIVQTTKLMASHSLTNATLVPSTSASTTVALARSLSDIRLTNTTHKSDPLKVLSMDLKQLDDSQSTNNGTKTSDNLNGIRTPKDTKQIATTSNTTVPTGIRLCPPAPYHDSFPVTYSIPPILKTVQYNSPTNFRLLVQEGENTKFWNRFFLPECIWSVDRDIDNRDNGWNITIIASTYRQF